MLRVRSVRMRRTRKAGALPLKSASAVAYSPPPPEGALLLDRLLPATCERSNEREGWVVREPSLALGSLTP
jgi:hypothetical protein